MRSPYRGRLAPTPTGHLHLGHARTFLIAWQRCRQAGGCLIYRDEDLDPQRCKPEYSTDAMEDLRWLELSWEEGPDCNGPHAPYVQSMRMEYYLEIWKKLHAADFIYPCSVSRKQLREHQAANPSDADEQDTEPLFPVELRPPPSTGRKQNVPGESNWRFRVPDGIVIKFNDKNLGSQNFTAGVDFGDFLVWRKDGVPSYELAVVADDIAMGITEVVRGADLLRSTARQLLLYDALHALPPDFFHCELLRDDKGQRLAKRHDALAIRTLRERGHSPEAVLEMAGIRP